MRSLKSKPFLDDLIGVDDTYYLNTLGTLLFSLQDQFERNSFFEEITLLELGQYTLGSFHGLLDAYDRLVHSGHYDKTFLLNLGKTLLTDSYHYLEFVAGLYITSNFEYEEVKEVVSNLDEIIQLALYYDLWEEEMIAALYLWELDDHLFDVFKKFSEEDNFHARAVFFLSFVPLREEVGLFFANNMDVLGYAMFYSRYIDINHFLINHFSDNLLIGAVVYGIYDYKDFISEEEKEKNIKFHKILVDTLITKDYAIDHLPFIYQYYEVLKKNNNELYKKLDEFFETNPNIKEYVEKFNLATTLS